MRIIYLSLLIFCVQVSIAQKNNYEKGWDALSHNKTSEASEYFKVAMDEKYTAEDAYISNLYLKTYTGKEKEITDFAQGFFSKAVNPYPYLYALWFNNAVTGEYGKKQLPHQLKFIEQLIGEKTAPGSIVASANYQHGMHTLFSNDFGHAQSYFDAIGNIRNWQFTGPFENLSESGFYKNYGTLDHPEPTAVFKSATNADVKWFAPNAENKDGWNPVIYQINRQTAVTYAQTFLNSPEDLSVILNIGFSGAIKVWLNDELTISEPIERVTDFDAYSVKCNLKKGTNRLLVQLSYSNSTYPNFSVRITDDNFMPIRGLAGSSLYAAYPKKNIEGKSYRSNRKI